ncbi:hypothetical protein SUDANB121_00371 [Nocardiopsis dassonvillei]
MVAPGALLHLGHRLPGERVRPRLEKRRAGVEANGCGAPPWIAGLLVLGQGLWLTGALEGFGAFAGRVLPPGLTSTLV